MLSKIFKNELHALEVWFLRGWYILSSQCACSFIKILSIYKSYLYAMLQNIHKGEGHQWKLLERRRIESILVLPIYVTLRLLLCCKIESLQDFNFTLYTALMDIMYETASFQQNILILLSTFPPEFRNNW